MPLSEQSEFSAIGNALQETIDAVVGQLRSMPPSVAAEPLAPGKWSRKQVMGHLIDSASNNHQRFVRAQQAPSLDAPGYDQNHWVNSQRYQDCDWLDLVRLWHAYNHHLSHVVGAIPEAQRTVLCRIGSDPPVTLGFLAYDYVVHLKHHLAQLTA